jgi:NTP pyrophosphatase (non-canonical NTP hydrolase)
MDLAGLQDVIARTYLDRDRARGLDGTFRWFVEEVGELARSFRMDDRDHTLHELGDVIAWLTSVANLAGLSMEEAAARYAKGCPRCGQIPCACPVRDGRS